MTTRTPIKPWTLVLIGSLAVPVGLAGLACSYESMYKALGGDVPGLQLVPAAAAAVIDLLILALSVSAVVRLFHGKHWLPERWLVYAAIAYTVGVNWSAADSGVSRWVHAAMPAAWAIIVELGISWVRDILALSGEPRTRFGFWEWALHFRVTCGAWRRSKHPGWTKPALLADHARHVLEVAEAHGATPRDLELLRLDLGLPRLPEVVEVKAEVAPAPRRRRPEVKAATPEVATPKPEVTPEAAPAPALTSGDTPATPGADQDDEALLRDLRAWSLVLDRRPPVREVRARYGIGYTRARDLLASLGDPGPVSLNGHH